MYSVPGPNFLGHHDGQHGKQIMHYMLTSCPIIASAVTNEAISCKGLFDGVFQSMVSLMVICASSPACAQQMTIMHIPSLNFRDHVEKYGLPSQVWGDPMVLRIYRWLPLWSYHEAKVKVHISGAGGLHEPIISTTWRLSDYPCSSVHNICIERLWVDVTKQLGAKWAEFFKLLEVQYELDPSNSYHIWLIHMLFLDTINDEIDFSIHNWNAHRLQIAHKCSRSP